MAVTQRGHPLECLGGNSRVSMIQSSGSPRLPTVLFAECPKIHIFVISHGACIIWISLCCCTAAANAMQVATDKVWNKALGAARKLLPARIKLNFNDGRRPPADFPVR